LVILEPAVAGNARLNSFDGFYPGQFKLICRLFQGQDLSYDVGKRAGKQDQNGKEFRCHGPSCLVAVLAELDQRQTARLRIAQGLAQRGAYIYVRENLSIEQKEGEMGHMSA
jgi:hypothetical protein